MATFAFFGATIELPAALWALQPTTDETAWLHGRRISVRLASDLEALRVHTAGKSFPGRMASREAGAWVLIGDVIETSSGIANNRSLPAANPRSMIAFTHVSEVLITAGTVLNIGLASAKFGGAGGGLQAEFVEGPPMRFRSLSGRFWHGSAANA